MSSRQKLWLFGSKVRSAAKTILMWLQKNHAMLLNYCQLWHWTDGYNAVTVITGGMCTLLTADGGYTGTAEVLQFSTCATELRQNHCKLLHVWHEPFVSLSRLLRPAWTVSVAERKLKEQKHLQSYPEINALSYLGVPWRTPLAGEVSGIRRDGYAHTSPSLPSHSPRSTPPTSLQAKSITRSVLWGCPHCEWFKWLQNYRKNQKWL